MSLGLLYLLPRRCGGGSARALIAPTLGGALVELSDWRLVFLVNLPLGAAIAFAGLRLLEARPPREGASPTSPAPPRWRSRWPP